MRERESGSCRGENDERRDLRALSLLLRTEMESRSLVNFWALASASLPLVSSFCSRQPRRLARLAGGREEEVFSTVQYTSQLSAIESLGCYKRAGKNTHWSGSPCIWNSQLLLMVFTCSCTFSFMCWTNCLLSAASLLRGVQASHS